MPTADWSMIGPVLAVLAAALGMVALDLFPRRPWHRSAVEWTAYLGLIAAIALLHGAGEPRVGFGGALIADPLSRFMSLAILLATALAVPASLPAIAARGLLMAEYLALLLLSAAGMMLLVMSHDLITMFLSVEVLSLALYVLCGIARKDARSNESAMKYFVLGAFATGFLLYGMALVYGAAGTVFLSGMSDGIGGTEGSVLAVAGVSLIVAGFAFKLGAAPFHMWVPDVYEGAPTPVTAFMSVAVKAAGLGALARLLVGGMALQADAWGPLAVFLAALTMVVGNLGALTQASVKRMLAYSSIAHSGYALIGVASAASPEATYAVAGISAALFYAAAYLVMTLGAFVFLMFAGRPGQEAETYDHLAGLARRRPWAAALMTVLMVSLAGIPPTAGFIGKFVLFKAAVEAGQVGLAVIGVITSAVGVYYYLRVVVVMYMHEPEEVPGRKVEPEAPPFDPNLGWVVAIGAALTLLLGVYPTIFLNFSRAAASTLLP
ncbi:MAG: NADH-quinone oxidoreductase subunit N [Planctomycetes bacterium]|nr:NADH-quinone oxidoreductase subunit N [Planctomycetota bacterium]